MLLRLSLALGTALALGGAALACTTTTIVQQAAPADPDAGAVEPGATEPGPADAGADATTAPFVWKPAPPGTFAQAISAGGAVIKAPKLLPIVFAADDQRTLITSFTTKLATSTYWGQISAEYGVGALTAKTPVVVSDVAPATIDDSQIGPWLAAKLTNDKAHFGQPDPQTLYIIYYPTGTTITQGSSDTSCIKFGGYHSQTTVGGTDIGYAVIPRCAGFAGLTEADAITNSSSHEILEWATDPLPMTDPAYMLVDDAHAVWSKAFLGELGDLCAQMGDVSTVPGDLGFAVQRQWSNASAKAGHHPCVPAANTPYFTAFPAKLDTIAVTDEYGRSISTQGFKVGVGQSKTIDLTMYSDGPMASWSVQVMDLTAIRGSGSPEFSYKLNKTKGTAGDTLQLTVTGVSAATEGQGFLLVSQSGGVTNLWPVWVIN
jgi:hypothetical protein